MPHFTCVAEVVGFRSIRSRESAAIPGYDRLDRKEITDQLSRLSQVELATVETY